MATSNRDPRTRPTQRTGTTLSRYDLLLLVIPAAFVLALVAMQVFGLSTSLAMGAASIAGALAVADGLFVNPPRRSDR